MKLSMLAVGLVVLGVDAHAQKPPKPPKDSAISVIIIDAEDRQIGVPGGPAYFDLNLLREAAFGVADWIFLDGTGDIVVGSVNEGEVLGLVDIFFSGPGCLGPAFVELVDVEGAGEIDTKVEYRGLPTLAGDRTNGFFIADLAEEFPVIGEAQSILRKFGQGCEAGTFPFIGLPAVPVQVTYAPPLRIGVR